MGGVDDLLLHLSDINIEKKTVDEGIVIRILTFNGVVQANGKNDNISIVGDFDSSGNIGCDWTRDIGTSLPHPRLTNMVRENVIRSLLCMMHLDSIDKPRQQ